MLSSTWRRSSIASSSSKSAFDALRASGSSAVDTQPPLDVVLPDPMYLDQIGGAYCAGRSARDDDHQIATLVAAEFQQRLVDLLDHSVGRLNVRHDERLGAPAQRELAADLRQRREG